MFLTYFDGEENYANNNNIFLPHGKPIIKSFNE